MTDDFNLNNSSPRFISKPSLVVDKSGRIIALSSEFRKIVSGAAAHQNFFDLFYGDNLDLLRKLFSEAKENEITTKDKIEIELESSKEIFDVVFIPLRSENNLYLQIAFDPQFKEPPSTEVKKFWIASSDIKELVDDQKIIRIIDKIKLTFPFSFIEKAKVQKEINEIEEYFWMKDASGKYILVNEKYAESIGYKANQVENKTEAELLPKYLADLYSSIDNYITNSTNTVLLESSAKQIVEGVQKNISVVEIPLCDLDNNVVAIIGFTKKSDPKKQIIEQPKFEPLYFKTIPFAICIIDNENKIIACTKDFLKLFNLGLEIDLVDYDVHQIFEREFISLFETFQRKDNLKNEHVFSYLFSEKTKLAVDVKLIKIYDEEGKYIATQVSFLPKVEKDLQFETKAKMYDILNEYVPEAIFIYDIENLKFLEVNEAALKLYGYKRNDFLNMDLTDLYAPEDIQTLIETGESKSAPGEFSGPWRHKKKDGSSVLVESSRISIEFKGKKAHLNVVRNISAQADTKKKQQILESVFTNTNEPVLITDKDGFITEINEPVSKKIGYSKKDLESRPFISLVSDDDRAKVNKNIFQSNLLKTTSLDIDLKKSSGTFHKAILIATPIKNFNSEIDSFCLIVRPLEEPISAKDVNHLQEDVSGKIDPPFLSNVFHEILTPINVILGFTQEIGESIKTPNEEQKEAIEIIKENQKLLLQIMDNAVEYSTLEQKVIKFRPEEIRFVDLLNELKENTRKTAESKKVELSYGKISSSLSVETDRQKFVSLISLFITFAIQITKENSIFLSAYSYDANYFAIGIKDKPNTITQYLLKALNDIFTDDENLSRRNYGFSRFSVKLAKKLIDLLSVKKEIIMKGTEPIEFAFLFPLKFIVSDKEKMEVVSVAPPKVIEKTAAYINESTNLTEEVISAKPQIGKTFVDEPKQLVLSQLSCLYFEDQVDSQMLFKVQMKDLKSIEFAPSFESALPLLKTKKFDFIVMDINLQGEYNGLDALRIIQRMPGYKNTPIIASTAYLQPGARDNFIAAGFTEFVSKPLLRDKLIEVLKILFT